MESHPTPTHDPMAVEATNTTESAAARQEPAPDCCPEVLLNDDGLEQSPTKKRKVCKTVRTLMCMSFLVPNMYRVGHSWYVSGRVFPSYTAL